jgi:beta-galactosidase
MKRNSHLEWPVKYAPGTLRAIGYKDGKQIVTAKVETTGAPTTVQLTPHRATIMADGADVSVITVQVNDAQGRLIPTAANEITFTLSGPGKIIGVGNGNPSSHEPEQFLEAAAVWRRRLFNGLAQIIVQSTREAGEIKLTASADGLAAATTVTQSQPGAPRPFVP